MNKQIKIILFGVLLSVICSCEDQYNICDQPKDVNLKAGLYQVLAGVETPAMVPSFSLSILGGSSLIYNQQVNLSKFSLSLNPDIDSSKYFIQLSNSLPVDTLTIMHTAQSILISPECGSVYIFSITGTRITHNSIDSVKVINPAVNTTSGENIKFYY